MKFDRFNTKLRSTIETKQDAEMAFDMYAGPNSESIQLHEEAIFEITANEPSKFPELNALYAAFYSDPLVSDQAAGRLVHELIEVLDVTRSSNRVVFDLAARLLPFFRHAFRNKEQVRCSSD
ncbi:MAG: hypothetical protein ACI9XZ_004179 [Alphaproteobacteria bacterium]